MIWYISSSKIPEILFLAPSSLFSLNIMAGQPTPKRPVPRNKGFIAGLIFRETSGLHFFKWGISLSNLPLLVIV